MAKNIRSKYIKNLISESKGITKDIEDVTKETLKDILKETVNAEFRSILAEGEDDFEEEEVNADTEQVVPEKETEIETDVVEEPGNEEETETSAFTETEPVDGDSVEDGESEEENAIWDELEQYKDDSGEYDLTGMDGDDVVKVLKVMKPEDGVRVVKNSDGTIKLTDDDNDTEYIIDIEPEEDVFEIDVDESVDECGDNILGESDNTGYTDNYQKKTAMTTPDNHEPSPMNGYRDWDKGAPHGTEKPWAHKGDPQPYNENKDAILEVELEDGENESAMTMSNKRTVREPNGEDNGHARARRHRNRTGVNPTMNPIEGDSAQNEAIKRKANEVFLENKQLKEVAVKIKDKLEESYLMNYNLGKIVKIITENSTTRDEKIDIVNRFSDVKSIEESKRLYETIKKELSTHKSTNTVESTLNGNINESRQWKPSVVETSMYRSEDLQETLDLMERMDRLGRN